jgi:hypothetical protein
MIPSRGSGRSGSRVAERPVAGRPIWSLAGCWDEGWCYGRWQAPRRGSWWKQWLRWWDRRRRWVSGWMAMDEEKAKLEPQPEWQTRWSWVFVPVWLVRCRGNLGGLRATDRRAKRRHHRSLDRPAHDCGALDSRLCYFDWRETLGSVVWRPTWTVHDRGGGS